MQISIIVAIAQNYAIGKGNGLLWHLSDDLKLFKKTTTDHTIIMGRKTYESIGKALPKRRNIVISRNAEYQAPGCELYASLPDAFSACANEDEVFVIGGGAVYKEALPIADNLYLSEVAESFEADTFFPGINSSEWDVCHAEYFSKNEKNDYDFVFKKLSRVRD